jgi:hypothetical protein
MNISPEEALALLERWRQAHTLLRIHLPGRQQPIQATIGAIAGSVITVISSPESLQIDLEGSVFNGDGRPEISSNAYLTCEFRNGDRYSFYAPRSATRG